MKTFNGTKGNITTAQKLRELYPNKDYSNKLKKQFTYYEMIDFSIRMNLKIIKDFKQKLNGK